MRSPIDMDTVQIEITNACVRSCSNCTRFCGHHESPYFMETDYFKAAVDSMKGYPKMVGIMGGEPLLHPEFEVLCEYMRSKFPKEQLGLWTAFPVGYEHYREAICETFGNIFLNDHSRGDIFHHPLLVASEEILTLEHERYYMYDRCWVQNSWSAAINPNGAFFCEVAAAWSILLRESTDAGWPLEPDWWWRIPAHFASQIARYCGRCGGAMPLQRRSSIEVVDDISPKNLELLRAMSPKLRAGKYLVHDLKPTFPKEQKPLAAYKDMTYRERLARRYRIFLQLTPKGFLSPHLMTTNYNPPKSIYEQCKEEWQNGQSVDR